MCHTAKSWVRWWVNRFVCLIFDLLTSFSFLFDWRCEFYATNSRIERLGIVGDKRQSGESSGLKVENDEPVHRLNDRSEPHALNGKAECFSSSNSFASFWNGLPCSEQLTRFLVHRSIDTLLKRRPTEAGIRGRIQSDLCAWIGNRQAANHAEISPKRARDRVHPNRWLSLNLPISIRIWKAGHPSIDLLFLKRD